MRLRSAGSALLKPSVYPSSFSLAKPRCADQSLNSLSIIISNAPIKANEISCSSQLPSRHYHDMRVASNVMNASVAYSSSINLPHEYFDYTRMTIGVYRKIRTWGEPKALRSETNGERIRPSPSHSPNDPRAYTLKVINLQCRNEGPRGSQSTAVLLFL